MSSPPGVGLPAPNFATRGPAIVACAVVLMVVPTIAVGLRLWSRAVSFTAKFWWDDWTILVTLVFSHIFLATHIWWVHIGLGKHEWMIPRDRARANAIADHVAIVWYDTVITMIKISAVMLYTRIFKVERSFRITLWIVGILTVCWWVILMVVHWMWCTPVAKTINPSLPGHCHRSPQWLLSTAFINSTLDLAILLLPMPMIWRLRMKVSRKILITIVFIFGYCSAFLSFARFIIIVRRPDLLLGSPLGHDSSWNLVPLLYLSMLEAPFAIIALCGPCINLLVQRTIQLGFGSLFSSRRYATPLTDKNSLTKATEGNSAYAEVDSEREASGNPSMQFMSRMKGGFGNGSKQSKTSVTSDIRESTDQLGRDQESVSARGVPMGAIRVKREISVGELQKRELVWNEV